MFSTSQANKANAEPIMDNPLCNWPLLQWMAPTATRQHRKMLYVQSDVEVVVTVLVIVVMIVIVVVIVLVELGARSLSRVTRSHAFRTCCMGSRFKHSCDFPPRQLQPVLVRRGAKQQLQLIGRGRRCIGRDTERRTEPTASVLKHASRANN